MKTEALTSKEILDRQTSYQEIGSGYDWQEACWQQFLEDVLETGRQNRQGTSTTHYMGSFIYQQVPADGAVGYKLVEGQQRLATFYLLLLALKKQNLFPAKNYFENEVSADNEIFKTILSAPETIDDTQKDAKIYRAYAYFTKAISTQAEDAKQEYAATLLAGLEALLFIAIELDETGDAMKVFESLNFKGERPNDVELVHNYLFMQVSNPADQKLLEEKYYKKIQVDIFQQDLAKMTDFLHQYLIVKYNCELALDVVYGRFKEQFPSNYLKEAGNVEKTLAEMLSYANYFAKIVDGKEEDTELNAYFKRFSWLYEYNHQDWSPWYPFLLQLYQDYDKEVLGKEEFLAIIKLICSYNLRRKWHNHKELKDYSKLYELYNNIKPESTKQNGYLTKFHKALQGEWGGWQTAQKFYSDQEMYEHVITAYPFYVFKRRKDILIDLANAFEQGGIAIVKIAEVSIDHIFPPNPTANSLTEFLNDKSSAEIDLELYKHLPGNLALIVGTSSLGDAPFTEKKEIIKHSPYVFNNYVKEQTTWTYKNVLERTALLAQKLFEIYPDLDTIKEEYQLDL